MKKYYGMIYLTDNNNNKLIGMGKFDHKYYNDPEELLKKAFEKFWDDNAEVNIQDDNAVMMSYLDEETQELIPELFITYYIPGDRNYRYRCRPILIQD